MLLLGGCISKVEQIIEVGMEFKKAEKLLMDFGATDAQLQIRPEKSISGKYMKLEIYALDKNSYIVINHEENIIKKISLHYIKQGSNRNVTYDFNK